MQKRGAIVTGLGFGDEGKGTVVDFLCSERPVDYVIRFSGGPQTAHNVVTDDGRHHTFAQFGSGTFQGAKTILSEYVLVNPFNMVLEADHLLSVTGEDPFDKTYISENALLITPIHVEANRQREINRGAEAHGSCGEGIGETRAYALNHSTVFGPIIVKDMINCTFHIYGSMLREKLTFLKRHFEAEIPGFVYSGDIEDILDGYMNLMAERKFQIVKDRWIFAQVKDFRNYNVFEGSQGVLLDEDFGFHPHTTWSAVTDRNALKIIRRSGIGANDFERIGVTRTYTTRHGFGPFPSEFEGQEWREDYPEHFNAYGRFQGAWRAGLLDLVLLEYAVKVNKGLDSIALTHCDIVTPEVVTGYEELEALIPAGKADLDYQETLTNALNAVKGKQITQRVNDVSDIVSLIEARTGVKVRIGSKGPTAGDKFFF